MKNKAQIPNIPSYRKSLVLRNSRESTQGQVKNWHVCISWVEEELRVDGPVPHTPGGVLSVLTLPPTRWEGRDVSAGGEEPGKVVWTPATFAGSE